MAPLGCRLLHLSADADGSRGTHLHAGDFGGRGTPDLALHLADRRRAFLTFPKNWYHVIPNGGLVPCLGDWRIQFSIDKSKGVVVWQIRRKGDDTYK